MATQSNSDAEKQVHLLELLSSRICHDLISPVGAIHNGLEFLEDMGPDALEDALELMKHSTKQATTKLQAFRFAYGAGGRDASITMKDVHHAMGAYFGLENKVTFDWENGETDREEMPSGLCKLTAGALLLMGETLPKKGTITVAREGSTIHISAEGEPCKFRDGTVDALEGNCEIDNLDPRLVHPFVLGLSARGFGCSVITDQSENSNSITLEM